MALAIMSSVAADFTFARENRLASKQDFAYVFAKPTKVAKHHFLALCRVNTGAQPRLGLIIKKHIIKQAVSRVALRRLIRESFRHHKDLLKGLDIIILVRSECISLDKIKIREMVDQLWPAIGTKLNA